MKRIALVSGLTFAFGAPVFAQDAPQNPPIAAQATTDLPEADNTLATTGDSSAAIVAIDARELPTT
jgi:hypothetical protein